MTLMYQRRKHESKLLFHQLFDMQSVENNPPDDVFAREGGILPCDNKHICSEEGRGYIEKHHQQR